MSLAVSQLPRFNPFVPEFRRDPYAIYRTLRQRNPIHRSLGMWVLTRHADVLTVLRDRRFRVGLIPEQIERQARMLGETDHYAFLRLARQSIVFSDNPEHARLRRLVGKVFAPTRIDALDPIIHRVVDETLAPALKAGGMDGVGEFADPIPLRVMCQSLRIERGMWETIGRWTHEIRFLLEPGLLKRSDFAQVRETLTAYSEFLRALLDERRRRPGDDLISAVVAARADDDGLTEEEAIHACIMVFVAGNATTRGLIGNGLGALLDHPDEVAILRTEPALIDNAVLETLRWSSPLQQTKRVAAEPVTLDGVSVAAGDVLLLCLGAANRDPARFSDPERFDVRRNTEGQLGFGFGMHACLGGRIAQKQATIAFRSLLKHVSVWRAGSDARSWQDKELIVRAYARLPIVFAA